jgi:polyhydroxyalkanoate synthesis regulator phasin
MNSNEHPYKAYERTGVWKAIDKAITELVKNGDLTEQTARPYIVGFLTKAVVDRRLSSARLRTVQRKIDKTRAVSEELAAELSDVDLASHP